MGKKAIKRIEITHNADGKFDFLAVDENDTVLYDIEDINMEDTVREVRSKLTNILIDDMQKKGGNAEYY